MRATIIALIATLSLPFFLGGCEKISAWRNPELAACRKFISNGLRSSSTYSEASSSSAVTDSGGQHVKTVTILCDAANAYGTPVRGGQVCEFEVDPNGKTVGDPDVAASLAIADRALSQNENSSCCLRSKSPATTNPTENMPTENMEDQPLMSPTNSGGSM